jgi:hypothetical protein
MLLAVSFLSAGFPILFELLAVDFTLVLDGKSFLIAKQKLINSFELHPCLFDESAYQVPSGL